MRNNYVFNKDDHLLDLKIVNESVNKLIEETLK